MNMNKTNLAIFVSLNLAGAITSNAALLVYEGFDYASGTPLSSASGALGTIGNWTNGGTETHLIQTADQDGLWTGIPAGGYPNVGGFVDGNRVDNNGGYITLAPSVVSTFADGTSTWISFVSGYTNNGETNNHHKPNLAIGAGIFDSAQRAETASASAIGGGADRDANANGLLSASVWEGTAARVNSGSTLARPNLIQQLMVMRIDWGAAFDTVSLFAYDISTASYTAPTEIAFNGGAVSVSSSSNLDQATFNTLSFHSSRFSIDEIRIATTFDEVVGATVPEPSSSLLTVFGLLAYTLRRSRRS